MNRNHIIAIITPPLIGLLTAILCCERDDRETVTATAANNVTFGADEIAGLEVVYVRSYGLDDPPTNSCPTVMGGWIVRCAHGSQL